MFYKTKILFFLTVFALLSIHCFDGSTEQDNSHIDSAAKPSDVTSLMRIYPGIQPCAPNTFDNCYNLTKPPSPSIKRMIRTAKNDGSDGVGDNPFAETVRTFPDGDPSLEGTFVFPYARSNNDGRIQLVNGLYYHQLQIFKPEAIKMGLHNNPLLDHLSRKAELIDVALHPYPLPNFVADKELNRPSTLHASICEDSTAAASLHTDAFSHDSLKRNPRSCTALLPAYDDWRIRDNARLVTGDCYDLAILLNTTQDDGEGVERHLARWGMATNRFTVFIPKGKSLDGNEMWIYPYLGNINALPYYGDVHQFGANYNVNHLPTPPPWEYSWSYLPVQENIRNECLLRSQNDPLRPQWCAWVDSFDTHPSEGFWMDLNGDDVEDPGERWSGAHCKDGYDRPNCHRGFHLFEPTITSDGRLLIVNAADGGLMYSYSEEPCKASAWAHFKPISAMPYDNRLAMRYPLVKAQRNANGSISPFRDTFGQILDPHRTVAGAYLWIDREGRNLFFNAVNQSRDGYYTTEGKPQFDNWRVLNPDAGGAGKGVVVLGAWTKGKMVLLDNRLNASTFAKSHVNNDTTPDISLALYSDWTPRIRWKPVQTIQSYENVFNHYKAMSPSTPFDVVWTMTAGSQMMTDIIFDEYLMNNAFIVAHMNPGLRRDFGPVQEWVYSDGFVPQEPNNSGRYSEEPPLYGFKETPLLQNAATSTIEQGAMLIPEIIKLRGGARIEPLAVGGYSGSGVFLDGVNDHIAVPLTLQSNKPHWYIGMWIEPHLLESTVLQTLYTFPDDSSISLLPNKNAPYTLVAKTKNGLIRNIQLPFGSIEEQKYVHLGIFSTIENGYRKLVVRLNGTSFYNNETIFSPQSQDTLQDYSQRSDSNSNQSSLAPYTAAHSAFSFGLTGSNTNSSTGTFIVGMTTACLQSSCTSKSMPFRGWIDELKVYAIEPQDSHPGGYFEEFACNLASGSVVRLQIPSQTVPSHPLAYALYERALDYGLIRNDSNIEQTAYVCEQIESDNGQGSYDVRHAYNTTLCAGHVHKDIEQQGSLCARNDLLNIRDKPLVPNASRPDFSSVAFCLSCHSQQATLVQMKVEALTAGSQPRYLDPRRQPLNWPATTTGCSIPYLPFATTQDCSNENVTYNDLMLLQHIIEPL